MKSTMISRRRLIALATIGGAGALLAACSSSSPSASTAAQPAPTQAGAATQAAAAPAPTSASAATTTAAAPTKAAAPTTAPQAQAASAKPVGVISFLCRPDIVTAYGAEVAIKAFTDAHPGSKISLDKPPQGVDLVTKIRAAIASNSLVWDGYSVMETPWSTAQWVDAEIIQPMDPLIGSSGEKDAQPLLAGIIPTIKEAIKYKGKIYSIPGNVGSVALQWYWEPLKAVGLSKQPATWDETYSAAKAIKAKYGDKWIPVAQNATPLCGYFALLWAATAAKDLVTQDGLLNIQGQGSRDALQWMKKMVTEGLMPPTDKNVNEEFNRKGVAMLLSYDVMGEDAQKTYGYDAADTGVNIFPKDGEINSGTPFWMNGSVVFNQAKNPQGMMDFLIWWFGPSNADAQQTLVATAAKPCYSYTYDKYVKGNTKFAWENLGIDLVAKSVAFPANTYYTIESNAIAPWCDKYLASGSTLSVDDAIKGMVGDVQAKIQAQQG